MKKVSAATWLLSFGCAVLGVLFGAAAWSMIDSPDPTASVFVVTLTFLFIGMAVAVPIIEAKKPRWW